MSRFLAVLALLFLATLPAGSQPVPGSTITVTGTVSLSPAGFTAAQVTNVPTVQNASYVSGNCVGGFNAVTLSATNGGGVILNGAQVRSIGGSTPTLTLYVFDANPAASTCTDKGTFTLNSADVAKLRLAPTALTLAAPTGTTTTFAEAANLARIMLAGGASNSGVKTIYYALVSGSTFTPATTTDLVVGLQALVQ